MVAPTVSGFTQRLYDSLPEMYRVADETQANPEYPLLRWLALLGDQAGEIEQIGDRIDAGDLTDPSMADASWLPWLAQFVGVSLAPTTPEADARVQIESASAGWQSGTRAAIAAEARKALSGGGYVVVRPSPTEQWTIQVIVLPSEAPEPLSAVSDAVTAAGAKPAGFNLEVIAYAPEWDEIDALGTSFNDLDTQVSDWDDIDSTGTA